MTKTLPVRRRVARACVTIVAIGLALTTSSYVLTRDVVTRLNHQRTDRPANAALLVVQQLSSAVDQVLATASGVVAASGGDPKRFVTVLGPGSGTRATDLVLGNVASTSGLTRWSGNVVLGGQQFTMLVAADRGTNALVGTQLPVVTLLVGLLLTLVAAVVARTVVRRNYAVGVLQTENRALDLAMEQQRRVEAELRASQARVQAMLRDSPDAIALLDIDEGACQVLNRAAFLGHPVDELNTSGGLLQLVHPDDRDDADAQFDRLRQLDDDQVIETT